jgi:hypothetical protein
MRMQRASWMSLGMMMTLLLGVDGAQLGDL